MNVQIIDRSESAVVDYCDRSAMHVLMDGDCVFAVSDGEPEDANMSRDFSDVRNIPRIIRLAFEAGQRGESLGITYEVSDDI